MEFGASIFFTDYSISPTELAVAMEERGSMRCGWPSTRTSRCRGARPRRAAASCRSGTMT